MQRVTHRVSVVGLVLAAGMFGAHAAAQVAAPAGGTPVRVRSTGSPQRDTLVKVMRQVEIEFTDTRLEDVMRYIAEISQADIDVFWMDDRNSVGLDKEMLITLKVRNATTLALIEKVLERASADQPGGSTWQMSESGTLQIGPKDRLNKYKRVELYNVQDLLLELPDWNEVPDFDLQSVLQNTGQGGGGQSPFQENNEGNGPTKRPYEDRLNDLISLLTTLVEPEQWVDNGGDGASLRGFQGNLIVNAPDYVHRQINGYPYWPATATRVAQVKGRRWVTLGVDSSIAKIAGFTNVPVTAVTGSGEIVTSNPGGPGGSTAPGGKPAAQPGAKPGEQKPAAKPGEKPAGQKPGDEKKPADPKADPNADAPKKDDKK
ncbi:MAG: hypothetical protein SFY69_09450 [Planctomycetota bacterium]|nr:hypothetical protein [Planctomycetota bacterium]